MTEFLARISARKPLLTIALWLLMALIGGALSGSLLESATTTEFRMGGGAESQRAARLLEDRLRGPEPIAETVIVQSESLNVDDYSRECPAIEVDTSLGGVRVVGVLERLAETRGLEGCLK